HLILREKRGKIIDGRIDVGWSPRLLGHIPTVESEGSRRGGRERTTKGGERRRAIVRRYSQGFKSS
ncbi:hypothetical protein GBA52_024353, partial [Prunus armeniaca]